MLNIPAALGGYGKDLGPVLAAAASDTTPEAVAIATALKSVANIDATTVLAAPVDAVAATDTVTSNNTQVTANDTVTVNGKVYTFVASPAVEGDVHFVTNADTSLTNLAAAINHTGTPGTDYVAAAAHPTVSAGSVSSHAITLSAKTKGAAGNALTLAKSAATLTLGGATFSGGIDGTPGNPLQIVVYSGQPYICLSAATITTAGAWKKITIASLP